MDMMPFVLPVRPIGVVKCSLDVLVSYDIVLIQRRDLHSLVKRDAKY